jgi:hypothetical protein
VYQALHKHISSAKREEERILGEFFFKKIYKIMIDMLLLIILISLVSLVIGGRGTSQPSGWKLDPPRMYAGAAGVLDNSGFEMLLKKSIDSFQITVVRIVRYNLIFCLFIEMKCFRFCFSNKFLCCENLSFYLAVFRKTICGCCRRNNN